MGWSQRFREAYSKEAIEDSAKNAWRWTKIGVGSLGVLVILVLRHWLSQILGKGLLVGALLGFSFIVLLMLFGSVAETIWLRRRRAAVAPYNDVDQLRQLYLAHLAPSIKSATSYFQWLCGRMGSMLPLGPLLASLLASEILGPCSEAVEQVGRSIVLAVPGKLTALDFSDMKRSFIDLTWIYSRVTQWIELVKKDVLQQGSPEYDLLCRQHRAFVAELHKAETSWGLKEITKHHGRLEQLLPAPPPADPPSSTASG
ncbi:MAG TPA: hypothetical protein VKU44_04050 [Terriglobia bacterium]|nr:hypothetical protein [Terriglobia bacterium]